MSTITIKQDTLDSILTRLAALETDNDRLRTGMHNFNVDRNEADERIEDLKSRCDDLEVDNAELHEKNVELRESLASVESEVDEMATWQEQHTELQELKDEIERLNNAREVEAREHNVVVARLTGAYDSLKVKYDQTPRGVARIEQRKAIVRKKPKVAPRKKMGN